MSLLQKLFGPRKSKEERLLEKIRTADDPRERIDAIIQYGIVAARAEPEFDEEAEAVRWLERLPRCSRHILIASPRYQTKGFDCDLIADVEKFYPWIEEKSKRIAILGVAQAALLAFPRWLQDADLSDNALTLLEPDFRRAIYQYETDLLNKGIAIVRCPRCEAEYAEVEELTLNERSEGRAIFWTSEWRCPKDHVLQHQDHAITKFHQRG